MVFKGSQVYVRHLQVCLFQQWRNKSSSRSVTRFRTGKAICKLNASITIPTAVVVQVVKVHGPLDNILSFEIRISNVCVDCYREHLKSLAK